MARSPRDPEMGLRPYPTVPRISRRRWVTASGCTVATNSFRSPPSSYLRARTRPSPHPVRVRGRDGAPERYPGPRCADSQELDSTSCLGSPAASTWMRRGLACSATGMRTVRTPAS
ncbi:hypothetical protein ACFFX0_18770 [Citricoccus parietis]|uniref:Uncharacterized protein n=1 Tax=Citricoccus parietis TaxID=592307 RepID=A0ABV5G2H2_9MICC